MHTNYCKEYHLQTTDIPHDNSRAIVIWILITRFYDREEPPQEDYQYLYTTPNTNYLIFDQIAVAVLIYLSQGVACFQFVLAQ